MKPELVTPSLWGSACLHLKGFAMNTSTNVVMGTSTINVTGEPDPIVYLTESICTKHTPQLVCTFISEGMT